ncbi:hypothetical protein LJR042_003536 [Microbacterium maritypicum]|uniref:hypothetical protein n=1 Tax=Microbacterium maritypicum TaxID=33918 RepID=UPI003ED13A0B
MTDRLETVFVLTGELARDEGHHDLLPLPLGFRSREAAEEYVDQNQPLWGDWSIQPVPMAARVPCGGAPPADPGTIKGCGIATPHAPHTWGDEAPFFCCITWPTDTEAPDTEPAGGTDG